MFYKLLITNTINIVSNKKTYVKNYGLLGSFIYIDGALNLPYNEQFSLYLQFSYFNHTEYKLSIGTKY